MNRKTDLSNRKEYLFLFVFNLCSVFVYGHVGLEVGVAPTQAPPQVTITHPLNGTVFDSEQIRVDFDVSGTEVISVRILINDESVQLMSKTEVKTGQNTITIDVPPHDCKISIIARNKFGESIPAVVNLKRSNYIFKPTLRILAIGISKYDDPNLLLRFAAKDAIDFSQEMLRQQGLLYENVELRLLTDEWASAENIREGLNWLQSQTTYRDVAMLYIAGHGINNVGDFYIMPVNANMERINVTCINYKEIQSAIDATPGKLLVFMDVCHSGKIMGSTQRAAMLNMTIEELTSTESGAVIFTSSSGRQFSIENSEWNNGAFTKALVEGLNGAADLFGRETITVSSLSSYIADRVRELTNGQQLPTVTIPASLPDLPIAVVNINVNVTIQVENYRPVIKTETIDKRTRRHWRAYEFTKYSVGISYLISEFSDGFIGFTYFFNHYLGTGILMIHSQENFLFGNYSYNKNSFYGTNVCFRFLHSQIGNFALTTSVGVGVITRSRFYNRERSYIINPYDNRSTFGTIFSLGIEYRPVKLISVGLNAASISEIVFKEINESDSKIESGVFTLGLNFHF